MSPTVAPSGATWSCHRGLVISLITMALMLYANGLILQHHTVSRCSSAQTKCTHGQGTARASTKQRSRQACQAAPVEVNCPRRQRAAHDDEAGVDDQHEQHKARGRVRDGLVLEAAADEAEDGGEGEGAGEEHEVRDEEVACPICTQVCI